MQMFVYLKGRDTNASKMEDDPHTRSSLIREIQFALPKKKDLADKNKTIWVLIQGSASEEDNLLDVDGVSILRAGIYD